MNFYRTCLFLIGVFALSITYGEVKPTTVSIASTDHVTVTGDLYLANQDFETPFILLFHQAGSSRGEYREIAPKLAKAGFNCLAIDQRSGGTNKGVVNETAKKAKSKGVGTNFPDAIPDMLAAAEYARKNYAKGPLIGWGSSYSAALVLKLAGDQPELFSGALAFSPGEYFTRFGHSSKWIQNSAGKITAPVFVTSAKSEKPQWEPIFNAITGTETKTSFVPKTRGNHGSKALWEEQSDHASYWSAVLGFLKAFK